MRNGEHASAYLGTTQRVGNRDILFDQDCVDSAQTYVNYCSIRIVEAERQGGAWWLEERFDLAPIHPPFEAGGTGDMVAYFPADRLLEIIDLKNGRGVVEVNGNKQLRTYGLGALLTHPTLDVDQVRVTIVQPRVHHADGRTRSETFTVGELVEWTVDLLAAMKRSAQAAAEFGAEDWAEKWLAPGNCTFCPAEGFCPALKSKALAVADVWFEDSAPRPRYDPTQMSPEELAKTLDLLDQLESWIKAVRSYAHTKAEGGTEIPGYQLVAKQARDRKWEGDPLYKLRELGLSDDDIFTAPELKSVAQIEKALGSKRKKEIEGLWHKPELTGTNLVSVAKTTRPAVQSTADRYFEPETES